MGCCCKKKQKAIEDHLLEDNDSPQFNIIKAQKLLKLIIENDYKYNHFLHKIEIFDDNLFEQLFKGNIDYFKENTDSYFRIIGNEEQREFFFLLFKLEDFQTIFIEWYKDETKHDFIKELWKKNYCIGRLKYKNNQELENIMHEIIKDSKEINNIQYELKDLIYNSQEKSACDIKNYLEFNYEEFYSLIEASISYKNSLIEKKLDNDETCKDKFEGLNMRLIKKLKPFFENKLTSKLKKKLQNNEVLNKIFQKNIIKEIERNYRPIPIGYNSILKLTEQFKHKEVISKLLTDIKDYYHNIDPLNVMTETILQFLNLCNNIKSFYDNLLDYKYKKTKFTEKLEQIHTNFENHRKEIKNLDLNFMYRAQNQIIRIGEEMNQDKNDILDLIEEIRQEINKQKKFRILNGVSLASNIFNFFSSIIGMAATSGGLYLLYGASATVNFFGVTSNSKNIKKNNSILADLSLILKKANAQYNEIKSEIEKLKELYDQNNLSYIPINIDD